MQLAEPLRRWDASGVDRQLNRPHGVRHIFHAAPLPPTPKPRQFSYLLSTFLLAGSAVSFYYRLPVLGMILGVLVVIGGAILTTTPWCLGSRIYRTLLPRAAE